MKVLAIIPARGGSKSIPLKNIRTFCGKPLIAYSIETALSCSLINRVIVSSDSDEIIKVAQKFGAEVPFVRPKELAKDDTTDLPVFIHCLDFLKEFEGYEPDIIVQLRPTSPLRTVGMINEGIQLLVNNPLADSVRAMCEPSQNPYKMWKIEKSGYVAPLLNTSIKEAHNQPRQKLPETYWQNGYLDVTRNSTIMKYNSMTGKRILPLLLNISDTIDIDNEITFTIGEMMYESRSS